VQELWHLWAQDYKKTKKKKEEKHEEANVAVGVGDNLAMFLAVVSGVTCSPTQVVHLMEKNVVLVECPDGVWVLDTGASNYMIVLSRDALTS
jgi:hypothetical protein